MNIIPSLATLSLIIVLAGCTTSTQVQEMIDQSHQDYRTRADSHAASIDLLKQSAIAALEKTKENAATIAKLEPAVADVQRQLQQIRGDADAAKIMSAANTVKVADMDEALASFKETFDKALGQLSDIDKLYEDVMMAHYQTIADSASVAIHALKMDGVSSSNGAPVELSAPIEIIAPDTSMLPPRDAPSTNAAPTE